MLVPISGLPPHYPQLVGGGRGILYKKLAARGVSYRQTGTGQRAEEKRRENMGSGGKEKGMVRKNTLSVIFSNWKSNSCSL